MLRNKKAPLFVVLLSIIVSFFLLLLGNRGKKISNKPVALPLECKDFAPIHGGLTAGVSLIALGEHHKYPKTTALCIEALSRSLSQIASREEIILSESVTRGTRFDCDELFISEPSYRKCLGWDHEDLTPLLINKETVSDEIFDFIKTVFASQWEQNKIDNELYRRRKDSQKIYKEYKDALPGTGKFKMATKARLQLDIYSAIKLLRDKGESYKNIVNSYDFDAAYHRISQREKWMGQWLKDRLSQSNPILIEELEALRKQHPTTLFFVQAGSSHLNEKDVSGSNKKIVRDTVEGFNKVFDGKYAVLVFNGDMTRPEEDNVQTQLIKKALSKK